MTKQGTKDHLAGTARHHEGNRQGRRDLLRRCATLGLGLGASGLAGLLPPRPAPRFISSAQASTEPDADPHEDLLRWLRDVGRGFRGSRLRMVTEATPPSLVINRLVAEEFTPATGIDVQIELLPLERAFQRTSLDLAGRTARYDIYYLDQSWIALFAEDMIDPREKYDSTPDLAFPNYDWDDFLPALTRGISMYQGRMVGIPFDVPLFIMFYRQDLLADLGLAVPQTLADYAAVIEAVQAAKAPRVYGSTGQMKSGHYSLNCEWTAWLWAHGGSVFDAQGRFSGGDAQGLEGLDYMMRLRRSMPSQVDDWTWDGQAQSLLQGVSAVTLTWAEIFPATDDPAQSRVVGLMDAAPPPWPDRLRPPGECGYGEIPNIGHQGGSALALSRFSNNIDAAWVFLQWATCAEVQTRASLLGGGASPTRASVFDDPRIRAAAQVKAGTTRHFAAVRQTMERGLGSEPDLPAWPEISTRIIPRELGSFLRSGQQDPRPAMERIKRQVDTMTLSDRG